MLEELLVVAKRRRDFHPAHVAGREAVEKRLLLVDRVAKPAGDEIGQAHADRVAVRRLGERQGRDDVDHRLREVLAVADSRGSR